MSAFVVGSFVAYAVHERFGAPSADAGSPVATSIPTPGQPPGAEIQPPAPTVQQPVATSTAAALTPTEDISSPAAAVPTPTEDVPTPTDTAPTPATTLELAQATPETAPTAPLAAGRLYKDGEYTGTVADAYYGPLQVKAIIQGGKIADVQFLDYPQDRRTSVRINRFAVPELTTEAIQAQSANVDVISGATLTSDAFRESLQSALNSAKERS